MKLSIILFILFLSAGVAVAQKDFHNHLAPTSYVASELDSIYLSVSHLADSLNRTFVSQMRSLDSTKLALNSRLQSVHRRVARNKLVLMIDSIDRVREKTIGSLNEKLESLKAKTVDRLTNLSLLPGTNEKISAFAKTVEGLKLSSTSVDLSTFKSTMNSFDVARNLSLSSIPDAPNIDV